MRQLCHLQKMAKLCYLECRHIHANVVMFDCVSRHTYCTCLCMCTSEFVRVICLWKCVYLWNSKERERGGVRAGVCQHVNWKGFIFAALLPGRKRGSGHRCEVWLMDVLPWQHAVNRSGLSVFLQLGGSLHDVPLSHQMCCLWWTGTARVFTGWELGG